MKARRELTAIVVLGASLGAAAASFDCAKAKAPVERAICADAETSKLDEALAVAYREAQAARGTHRTNVVKWQREWLRRVRDECDAAACLRKAYSDHLAELRAYARAAPASEFGGRYGRIEKGKPDPHEAQLLVMPLGGTRARIVGYASWVGDAAAGAVNVGETYAVVEFAKDRARLDDGNGCAFDLALDGDEIRASGDGGACGGLNVTFDGRYRRAS